MTRIIAQCQACSGEGTTETMTRLYIDGAQSWKRSQCSQCDGTGQVPANERCGLCGDEIMAGELVQYDGSACHAVCVEDLPTPPRAPESLQSSCNQA